MEPLPIVFYMLQYFQMIMHQVESLRSCQKDEVCFYMDGGAAGGLLRHQTCHLVRHHNRRKNILHTFAKSKNSKGICDTLN